MLLRTLLVVAAIAASACAAQPEASNLATPAPVVSDAARTANDTSAAAHHSDAASSVPAAPAAAPLSAASVPASEADAEAAPRSRVAREVTIPAGTPLRLRLASTVSSKTSGVEDPVQATVQRAVVVKGVTVIPAGAAVSGHVTEAARSGRVKGRARIGMRFNALRVGDARYNIRTASITREAPGTKKEDATKIGIGAGAGAIVGAVAGGKKGAAIGTAAGAGGGTAAVLATRGEEIALGRGAIVTTRLAQPLTIRIH